MSTVAQAEEAMVNFLGDDLETDRPTRHQRLLLLYRAQNYYARIQGRTPHGHQLDWFELDVSPGEQRYLIPVENFGGLFHVERDPAAYPNDRGEVENINFVDADILRVDQPIRTGTTSQRVLKVGWFSQLDSGGNVQNFIVAYPPGATDRLICYYNTLPDSRARLSQPVQAVQSMHLTGVPLRAALDGCRLRLWRWRGMDRAASLAECAARVPGLEALLAEEDAVFREEIWRPQAAEAVTGFYGINAARRSRRRIGRGL